ncbi:MAG: hypothetical protein KC413_25140 [Anaerolineales bacterium]|nr:hypothetical protein [Anaerolineales bacterium]MCA9979081.1 hypothetical protein [Anaerolineales bacterium]MCB8965777.1 hypothetical protein [Ardenticatenaceae bacterium]
MPKMDGTYHAFLLRLQRFHKQGEWRVTLQNVQTDEMFRFANEMEMVKHLLQLLAESREIEPSSTNESE